MRRYQWSVALVSVVVLSLFIVGCTGQAQQDAQSEAQAPEEDFVPVVSATGKVVPAQKTTLSFPIAGQVIELAVEEGDQVNQGDVIARLDTTLLDARVLEAQAALLVAEAQLARASAGARQEEIDQAERNVAASAAEIAAAAARRDDIASGAEDWQVVQAQLAVQQAFLDRYFSQNNYDQAIGWAINADPDLPEEFRDPEINPQVVADAQFALDRANERLAAAQARLDDLLDGADPNAVRAAEAQVWAAAAERNAAEAYLNLLQAGPQPESIEVAKAQVEQARVALEAAQAAREQAVLLAPFDGTIGAVFIRANEWVSPGAPILLLADLTTLQVETTDLNEIDVARIALGDSATVTFDALPDLSVGGTVTYISPKAAEGAGVNYTVLVELDEIPPGIRWGMTAFVDIAVEK